MTMDRFSSSCPSLSICRRSTSATINSQLSPSGSLAKMSRVQTLNLQNNALKVVQRHAFTIPSGSSLYRSFNIDLQSNQLTEKSFEPHFVANIRDNVKVNLNLERNMIRTVDEEKSFLREIFDVFQSDEGTTAKSQ